MPQAKHRVAIVYGAVPPDAPPDEQDVLDEVQAVEQALLELGHRVVRVPITLDLVQARNAIAEARVDVAFNLVESVNGIGALIHLGPALLESAGVPYTGAHVAGMALSCDKLASKRLLRKLQLPTPAWLEDPFEPLSTGHARYIVKSITEHASIGLDDDSVMEASAVPARLRAKGRGWFAEAYVDGREFNVGVLAGPDGPQVLPIAEIRFVDYPPDKPRIITYTAKWQEDSFEYDHTDRYFLDPEQDARLYRRLHDLALQCWHGFEQQGYTRIDFRVDERGEPWVLEVNANPCISANGGFMAAAGRVGLHYRDIVARIIAAAS